MAKVRQTNKLTPEETLEAKAAKKSGGSLREQDPNNYQGKSISTEQARRQSRTDNKR